MADEIAVIESSLRMQTTGNQEQDEAHIRTCAINTAMIAAGFCPNGCGEMDEALHSCHKCHFSHN